MIYELPRYPRTLHIPGSKGTNDPNCIKLPSHSNLVFEEKLDGSSVSIGFFDDKPQIYHRNTAVSGDEFDMLKRFIAAIEVELYLVLGERYIMYGEWMYAKHTIFYDALPSYFIEYDVYDRKESCFLSTPKRHDLVAGIGNKLITSVVTVPRPNNFAHSDIGRSNYVSPDKEDAHDNFCRQMSIDDPLALYHTDLSGHMEGLYIKDEKDDKVVGRYKFIRSGFVSKIIESGHWAKRKLFRNQLSADCRADWDALLGPVGGRYD